MPTYCHRHKPHAIQVLDFASGSKRCSHFVHRDIDVAPHGALEKRGIGNVMNMVVGLLTELDILKKKKGGGAAAYLFHVSVR